VTGLRGVGEGVGRSGRRNGRDQVICTKANITSLRYLVKHCRKGRFPSPCPCPSLPRRRINKSCLALVPIDCRLNAWCLGQANGTVARVNIGQIILSVRTRDSRMLSSSSHSIHSVLICYRPCHRSRGSPPLAIQVPAAKRSLSPRTGASRLSAGESTWRRRLRQGLGDGAYVQFLSNTASWPTRPTIPSCIRG